MVERDPIRCWVLFGIKRMSAAHLGDFNHLRTEAMLEFVDRRRERIQLAVLVEQRLGEVLGISLKALQR